MPTWAFNLVDAITSLLIDVYSYREATRSFGQEDNELTAHAITGANGMPESATHHFRLLRSHDHRLGHRHPVDCTRRAAFVAAN